MLIESSGEISGHSKRATGWVDGSWFTQLAEFCSRFAMAYPWNYTP
jgi:hypothetical protein